MRIDYGKSFTETDISSFEETFDEFKDSLHDYQTVVISDYNKGTVGQPVLDALKAFSGSIFVDTKKPDLDLWNCLPNCIVKINANECINSTGGSQLKLIVTMGAKGAVFLDKGAQQFQVPAVPVSDADTVGAGDSYLSGLVDGYLYSKEISTAMRCAELVARASVQKKGTGIVHARDIGNAYNFARNSPRDTHGIS